MEIKKATLCEVQDISRIHALSWKTAYKNIVPQPYLDNLLLDFWVTAFQTWIQNKTIQVQIIYENGKPIGCAAYGKSRDEKLPDWGEIVSLYLLPEYFGKSYGIELFKSVMCDIKQLGYKNVYLWVLKDNQRAKRFYEKNGFYSNHDECCCKIMNKELIDERYTYSIESFESFQ